MVKSLNEARKDFFSELEEGTVCPCCDRYAKEYKRQLYATVALGLIEHLKIVEERGYNDFIHVNEITKATLNKYDVMIDGDYSKLRFWGLIEEMPNEDEKKRTSGFWKITDRGIKFAKGEIKISKYFMTYNKQVNNFSDELCDINGALGNKFDFREVMGK